MALGAAPEKEPSNPAMSANRRARPYAAEGLEIYGGFVLIGGGVALIALASLLADSVAVAPIFAAFGCGLFALGCFFSRIEGQMEASKDGFKAVVREVKRRVDVGELAAESAPDVIEDALDAVTTDSSRRSTAATERAVAAVDRITEHGIGDEELTQAIKAYFESKRYSVTESGRLGNTTMRPDLVATASASETVIEVKAASYVGVAAIHQVVAYATQMERSDAEPVARVLAVSDRALPLARQVISNASAFDVTILAVDSRGEVSVVHGAEPPPAG